MPAYVEQPQFLLAPSRAAISGLRRAALHCACGAGATPPQPHCGCEGRRMKAKRHLRVVRARVVHLHEARVDAVVALPQRKAHPNAHARKQTTQNTHTQSPNHANNASANTRAMEENTQLHKCANTHMRQQETAQILKDANTQTKTKHSQR